MSFLFLNDLEYEVLDGSASNADVDSFGRSEGTTLEGTVYAPKREGSYTSGYMSSDRAHSYRDWAKGRGHYWTFRRVDGATTRFSKYSSDGGLGLSNAQFTAATTRGGWSAFLVNSGALANTEAAFGTESRYAMSVWKYTTTVSGGWQLCSAIYDGATLAYVTGAGAQTTAFGWATLSAASGAFSVSLLGKDVAGTNATALYSELMIVPYALATEMLTVRQARAASSQFFMFPYVGARGNFWEQGTIEVPVRVSAEASQLEQVHVDGGFQTDGRQLDLKIVER